MVIDCQLMRWFVVIVCCMAVDCSVRNRAAPHRDWASGLARCARRWRTRSTRSDRPPGAQRGRTQAELLHRLDRRAGAECGAAAVLAAAAGLELLAVVWSALGHAGHFLFSRSVSAPAATLAPYLYTRRSALRCWPAGSCSPCARRIELAGIG